MAATYTVKQVAEILGYSTNSIYTFLKEKRIKGVRVGKGRFRVPQSELDRLLHVRKENTLVPTSVVTPLENNGTEIVSKNSGVADVPGQSVANILFVGRVRIGLPNVFTWFIGLSAIIAGLSMYLYNQPFNGSAVGSIAQVVNAMRTLFIGGGLGVLLTNMVGGGKNRWKKVFNCVVLLAGLILCIYLGRQADVDGLFLYGSLVAVVLLSTVMPIGGLASFSLFVTFLSVTAWLVPLLGVHDPHVMALTDVLHIAPWVLSLILGIGGIGFAFTLWWGYTRERGVFWVCMWIAAVTYFILAVSYANGQYWSRAFFMIMVGVTSLFAAPWESINSSRNRKEQMTALAVYGIILGLLVAGIVVVGVMQFNVLETLKQDNTNKIAYTKTSVEGIIDSVESTLEGVATNRDFVTAVGAKDTAELNNVSRVIFDSNHNIRRVVILNSIGDGINLYPIGVFNQTNFAFRDYYIKARDTNQPYVTDLFTATADNGTQKTVAISVPLSNPDHSFAGVLVASLDLVAISARLQQIPVPSKGEYVSVVDSHGIRIVNPVTSLIGTPGEQNDPQLLGIKGQHGIADGTTYDGKPALVVYDTVDGVHWGVAIKTPYTSVYQLTSRATLVVLGVVLAAVILATFFLQGVHMHLSVKREEEENSP